MRRKQHREVSTRTPPRRMNLRLTTEHNLTSQTAEAEEVTEAVDNSEEDTKEASNKVEAKVNEDKVDKINEVKAAEAEDVEADSTLASVCFVKNLTLCLNVQDGWIRALTRGSCSASVMPTPSAPIVL